MPANVMLVDDLAEFANLKKTAKFSHFTSLPIPAWPSARACKLVISPHDRTAILNTNEQGTGQTRAFCTEMIRSQIK